MLSAILEEIVARTRADLPARERRVPLDALAARAGAAGPVRDFAGALRRPGEVAIIAEAKRRSPSKGLLCADYDPARLARAYAAGGAAALSVLTEPHYFDGALEHLGAARAAVALPALRKDFVVARYQVVEARAWGADAVLLIVGALDGAALGDLLAEAAAWGLAALVEVHDERELDRALAAGATLIGVNNRDLRTFAVNLKTTARLRARIPAHCTVVSESGLHSAVDLAWLRDLGVNAALVGEALVTQPDPAAALRALLGEVAPVAAGEADSHG
ncbi:MAG: indole-3-glycerol phosphate synthase TrpC [Chloroflexi bacterium]|nr:indole-3-glycerol phosphate synthase TrpC [Chloroflexota bacterium]